MLELMWIQYLLKFVLGGLCIDMALKLRQKKKLATGKIGHKLKTGTDGIQISKNYQLESNAGHIGLFAPTRQGKTTNVIIPNLLQNSIRGSIVVYDPSGEIYKTTSKYQSTLRKVILYEPLKKGIEYNLIQQCKDDREVISLAQSLLINGSLSYELLTGKKSGGTEWLLLSQNLLASCLIYAKQKGYDIKYALRLITAYTDEDRVNILSQGNQRCKELYASYMNASDAEKMQASIKGTIQSYLGLFYDDLAVNKTFFSADTLRKQETIVYVKYPEHMAGYLAPLIAPMFTQLINQSIDINGIPVWFIFEEFANLGQITGFANTISTAAKRDITFLLCLQDFNQLKSVYGNDAALTIWNNCLTKIILPGLSDVDTNKMISDLCDEEQVMIQQGNNFIPHTKKLFTPGEVRRIETGKCLIINTNYQPVLDDTNYYLNNKQYLERIK